MPKSITPSKHGGKREGAGRPPIKGTKKKKRFPMADDSTWEYLLKVGDGNASRGIDRLVEWSRRTELFEKLGRTNVGLVQDDTHDGKCPICGGFAVYWHKNVREYIDNPDKHWACENGHQK